MQVEVDTARGEIRAVRTLRKSGNSISVSIPPELLQTAHMELGDDVELVASFDGNEITLRPATNEA